MALHVLMDDAGANVDTALARASMATVQDIDKSEYGVCQVSIASAGTVSLQGRLSNNMPWQEITSFTATGAIRVTLMNQMIATLTGWDSGVVRVELQET